MNKTKFFSSLLVAGLLTASSVFVSCKDYDDDIKALQESIATNNDAIKQLMELKDNGIVITDVQTSGKDVILTLSDGTTKTIKGGQDGANAVVWTIGSDGYWYKDGVQTGYKAVGTDGKNGTDGTNGTNGTNGQDGLDGIYYVPNETTGFFDIYTANGVFVSSSNIRWKMDDNGTAGAGITAVQTAKSVIISGVEGYGDIVIPTAADLKSLVFLPKSYYWGIEATTVKTLTMPWYNITKELTSYIDEAAKRTETVGTKAPIEDIIEDAIVDYHVADGRPHWRYPWGTTPKATYTVTLRANAEYHINPSVAAFSSFGDNTIVDVFSDNKAFTRTGLGSAVVSFRGQNTGKDHDWYLKGDTLVVPLAVEGAVSTVTTNGKTFANNPGVTVFNTKVTYKTDKGEDVAVASDYAALVEETVKDLVIAHVPYDLKNHQLSETGMLNDHCGYCALPLYNAPYAYARRGMHLFQSIDEVKDYIDTQARVDGKGNGEGWDLVNWQKDVDLNKLVETHYTNTDGSHAVFEGEDFERNFKYEFELTSIVLGNNKTNESAHAAIYQDQETGHYFLHPQDPKEGGLDGLPYGQSKTTEVVINRVPVVRVKLIYKAENVVIDYAYLPIRITKDEPIVIRPTVVVDKYASEKEHNVVRYNDCWNEGGANQNIIVTNWRQTEEDIFSAPGLAQIFDRQLFDTTYEVEPVLGGTTGPGNCADAQQYTVAMDADGKYVFAKTDNTNLPIKDNKFGTITYSESGTSEGHYTSIFTWTVYQNEIRDFAVAKVTKEEAVRAIRFVAKDGNYNTNPDIYVIFRPGDLKLKNYTVYGDPELTAHIIKKYWYEKNTFNEGTNEIHANVITPEENLKSKYDLTSEGWKPKDFDDTFSDVFLNNFKEIDEKDYAPWNWVKFIAYEGDKVVDQVVPNPPFNVSNIKADFIFSDPDYHKTKYYGHLDNSGVKTFYLTNECGNEKSHKKLYAYLEGDKNYTNRYQVVATIDPWDYNSRTQLRSMKISLNWGDPELGTADPGRYAKALLNYAPHSDLENTFKAKVALIAVANIGHKAESIQTAAGVECPLELINNKFDVLFLRPVSIYPGNAPEITDAHHEDGVDIQKVYLNDLVNKYVDWRDVVFKYSPDYEQYYAPVKKSVIKATVSDLIPGQLLSSNDNVYTTLNGKKERLSQVTDQLELKLEPDAGDGLGEYITYKNLSSNVQDFDIFIPVKFEYYWGTVYSEVKLHVNRTPANAPRRK
jgi:hypothetical protein